VPAWSLFYEYVVNVLFGFANRQMGRRAVVAIVAGSGLLLVGLLATVGHLQFTGQMPKFLLGSVRTLFGFYVGVMLFRLWSKGRLPNWRIPPFVILVALALLLAAPSARPIGPILTFLIVFAAFPLLLVLGIENEPSGPLARLMSWLGILSFPLYAVHYPILSFLGHVWAQPPGLLRLSVSVAASVVIAWLCLKLWDAPIRARLTRTHRHFLARKEQAER
jgi:peptidoglycan/LPS O-acetylase OafA/YrhL